MGYRDDQGALETRRDELLAEKALLQQRLDAVAADLQRRPQIEQELADVEARLARTAEKKRRLLDDLRVASPCEEPWEGMTGDAQVRFCGRCEKNVYNLSAMTRAEAERLLEATEGSLCVRMYQRADGTLITNDCPVGATKKRRRLQLFGFGAGLALSASAAAAVFFGRPRPLTHETVGELPGELTNPPVPCTQDEPPTFVQGAAPVPRMGKVQVALPPERPAPPPPKRR